MLRRWTAAMFLLTTPLWAQDPAPANNTDISSLLSDGKKPCDADKKKAADAAAAEAKKTDAALEGLLGTEKKPEPTQKSLGAVKAMGNCK